MRRISLALAAFAGLSGCSSCTDHPNVGLISSQPVVVSPANLDFGDVPVGNSLAKALAISNTGSGPLNITGISLSEDGGGTDFSAPAFAPTILQPGAALPLQITFAPSVAGYREATLVITTDANPTTYNAQLTGIGTTVGLSAAPPSLDFACVAVNSPSTAQVVTLTNASNPGEPETVTLTFANPGDFQLTPAATQFVIAAGSTYPLSVVFAPTAAVVSQASITLNACGDDAGCSQLSLAMTGTGSGTTLIATPDPVTLGFVPLGETSTMGVVVQTQVVPFGSSCALPVTVELPGLQLGDAGFALDAGVGSWPLTLTPPASFPMVVTFTGQDGGEFHDTAVVQYALAGQSQPDLQIPVNAQAGIGPCQNLTITPPSVSFGTVEKGQTITESVIVTNPATDGGITFCEVTSVAITENDAFDEFAVGSNSTATPFYLSPGQSVPVDVTFTNDDVTPPDTRDGQLTLTATNLLVSADAGSFDLIVPLAATVTSKTCSLGFAPQVIYTVGNASTVAGGDFNGDGQPDVVSANYTDGTINMMFGMADGGFVIQPAYPVGGGPYFIGVGDLNADGRPDLAVVNQSDNTVSVLVNQDAGTFVTSGTYGVGSFPSDVVMADFRGIGRMDMVVTNSDENTFSVLLQNLDGTFATQVTYATGNHPLSVLTEDFDGDGKPDLLIGNQYGNTLQFFMGNGDGTFTPGTAFASSSLPISMLLASFVDGGPQDIAVADYNNNAAGIFLGDGGLGFGAQTTFTAGNGPRWISAADFNADGKLDVAVANQLDNTVGVLLGNGDGTFGAQTVYAAGPAGGSMFVADFNNDGRPDIAVGNWGNNTVSVLLSSCSP